MKDRFFSFWMRGVPDWNYVVIRIGFALAALAHLVELWPYRHAFLSDRGMVGQDAVISQHPGIYLSIYRFLESPAAVTTLFLSMVPVYLCLLLGIGSRFAIALSFGWYLSLVSRIGIGATGWDIIMSNFAFLLLVSPLGSFPAMRRKPEPDRLVPRYGLFLMRLQVFVIYWRTVFNRFDDEYWRSGEFLYYFFQSAFSRFPGAWAIEAMPYLRWLTWSIQFAELAIPLLLAFRRTFPIGLLLGVLLHLSISVVSPQLITFSLMMMMTYLCFFANAVPWINRFRSAPLLRG